MTRIKEKEENKKVKSKCIVWTEKMLKLWSDADERSEL